MTIQEAKEFYFKCMCIDYNMFNSNVEKYHDVLSCSTKDMRLEWKLEYIQSRIDLIHTDVDDAPHHFRNARLLLSSRDNRMTDLARQIVEVYEECPFMDELSKLIVAEGIYDDIKTTWYSGFSTICFYGDYSDRLKEATYKYYINLHFDENVLEEICKKIPGFRNVVNLEKLIKRADVIKEACDNAYAYIHSEKFEEDRIKYLNKQN